MSTKSRIKSLIAETADDRELYASLDKIARSDWEFGRSVGSWGPQLYERNRQIFSPLIERHLNSWTLTGAKNLNKWMDDAESNGDLRIFRALYQAWLSESFGWEGSTSKWQEDFLGAFRAAKNRAARRDVVEKYNLWFDISDEFAAELYGLDPVVTRNFVVGRLERLDWFDIVYKETAEAALREGDEAFYFELYRYTFPNKIWKEDVLTLAKTTSDSEALCSELAKRHSKGTESAVDPGTLFELLRARGTDVLPYLESHVADVHTWGQDDTWADFAAHSASNGWDALWSQIVKSHFAAPDFTKTVKELCGGSEPEWRRAAKLVRIAGAQIGWFEWRQDAPLAEEVALMLYQTFPEICRGPFAIHLKVAMSGSYEALAKAAAVAGDVEMIDVLAAVAVTANPPLSRSMKHLRESDDFNAREPIGGLDWYIQHYQALDDATFAARAVEVLGRITGFEHNGRVALRRFNPLYGVFFGDVSRYRDALNDVRDLLEAPCEEARQLGLRLLVSSGVGATAVAARNTDHLVAYFLGEAHRSTRILAFAALAQAATDSETLARDILERAREALDLRRRCYPRDRLIELIGRILYQWPNLRLSTEQPVIFGKEAAW